MKQYSMKVVSIKAVVLLLALPRRLVGIIRQRVHVLSQLFSVTVLVFYELISEG